MNTRTNAEKEWIRKLTTSTVTKLEEQKTPPRVVDQTEVKEPTSRSREGFGEVGRW